LKVTNIRREDNGDAARVVGTVAYEDSDRNPLEVFYEVPQEFASDLVPNPDSFLLACISPAHRHGERRLLVEGNVSPSR
jgi:hypothetical protein